LTHLGGEKKTKSEYEDTYIAGRSTSILTHLEGGKRKDKKDMEKNKKSSKKI
jgi:hypothetical protein